MRRMNEKIPPFSCNGKTKDPPSGLFFLLVRKFVRIFRWVSTVLHRTRLI